MALTSAQLIGYQRAEFDVASRRRLWLIFLQFGVAIPVAASVFFDEHTTLYWLALAGAVLLFLWLWCDGSYRRHREAAERGRRATLLIDGLGQPVSNAELSLLKERFEVSADKAAKWEDPAYFSSADPAGPVRLANMLAESAFWTSRLQAISARIMSWIFVALVGSAILAGFFVMPIAEHETMITAVRAFLSFLTFALSSDVWGAIQGHRSAASAIEEIRARIRTIQVSGYRLPDALLAMNDYNAAVESAPMNVPFAYRLCRSRLNAEWKDLNMSENQHEIA